MEEYYKQRHLERLASARYGLFHKWASHRHRTGEYAGTGAGLMAMRDMALKADDIAVDLYHRLSYQTYEVRA